MRIFQVNHSLISCKNTLGESPLWDHRRNAFFWVDIDKGLIQSYQPSNRITETWSLNKKIGCIALHADGGFILATEFGLSLWNPAQSADKEFLSVKHPDPQNLFNDGKVDSLGRFWVGSKGPKGSSRLWMLKGNQLVVKISDLWISNGLGWAANDGVFYHTDSGDKAIYRYDIDLETARLSNRTLFFKPEKGTPDGLTIDDDGNIWTAIWDGWQILQLNPAGEALTEIKMPVQRPTSIAFGGVDLRTLFITSASEGLTQEERARQPMAGDLFSVEPGVTGLKSFHAIT